MKGHTKALLASFLLASGAAGGSTNACAAGGCGLEDSDEPSLLQVARHKKVSPFPWWKKPSGPKTLTAEIFKPTADALANHQIKVGASISGGGNRAYTYSMGILRALHQLGVASEIDFVSSVSGGTWLASLYVYAKGSDEDLLGAPTTPSELNLDALKRAPSKFGQRVVAANNDKIMTAMTFATLTGQLHKAWQNFVGSTYLQPFGLNGDHYMAEDAAHMADIKKRNPALKKAWFTLPRTDRPKLGMQCILFAPLGYNVSWDNVVQLEVSARMSGVTRNAKVIYAPMKGNASYPKKNLTTVLGGGFIETFAFGGDAPTKKNKPGQVPAPKTPTSLAEVVGLSSMSPAGELAQNDLGLTVNPQVKYFNIPSAEFPTQERAMVHGIGDGGSIENSGIVPLLGRGAKKVFWIANSFGPMNRTYPWEEQCAEGSTMKFDVIKSGFLGQASALYGYGKEASSIPTGFFWEHNHVFKKEGALPLACAIWKLVEAGEPAVHQWSEEVLPNEYFTVKGGYKVDLMIVYLENMKMFTDKLPADTQDAIAQGDAGPLARFPIYRTQGQNAENLISYTNTQVNLLAAQGEHTIMMAQDKVKKFFTE